MAKPGKALACALVTLLGACGEESATLPTDVTELVPSRTDYILEADGICAQFDAGMRTEVEARLGVGANDFHLTRAGEIVFKPGRAPSPQALRRFGQVTLIPALRDQLADLRALTPPRGDEARVAAIYDDVARGVDRLARSPDLLADRDAVRGALTEARRAARRYGFATCGTYSGP